MFQERNPAYAPLPDTLEALAKNVIDAAYEVHTVLGPGMMEHFYLAALHHELSLRGIGAEREVVRSGQYKGVVVQRAMRFDLLIEGCLIVEAKAVERLHDVHRAQVASYLRMAGLHLGLLINFHEAHLKHGIRRVIRSPGPWESLPP